MSRSNYLVCGGFVVWSNERSSNLKEIIEFTVSINSPSSGLGSESSQSIAPDLHVSVVRNTGMWADSFLFVLESAVDVFFELVFESILSAGSDGFVFDFLLDSFVLGLVDEQLVRVVVEGGELHFAVDLVCESSFRVKLAQLDWGLAPERHGVCLSQGDQE